MERRRDHSEGPGGVHIRRCLACGHGGRSLQGDRGRWIYSCPSCEADLYARPAMSYAEMEGLPAHGARRHRVVAALLGLWRRVALRHEPAGVGGGRLARGVVDERSARGREAGTDARSGTVR